MVQSEIIYSIFVSSTSGDLKEYRARARDILLMHNLRPLEMEYFPAESTATSESLHRYLDAADAVVLLAGARYGSLVGQISYVEWEFNEAMARGIPVVCLVMSKQERALVPSISDEERERQENFIRRIKQHSKIAEFNQATFDMVFGSALNLLPARFPKGAGLIRLSDYHRLAETSAAQLHNFRLHETLLRLLGGMGLIRQHLHRSTPHRSTLNRDTGNSDTGSTDIINRDPEGGRLVKSGAERVILDRLLDLLYADLVNRPVTTRIIESVVRRLIDRLHGFTTPAGFVPDSIGELEASIDELFGEGLCTLKATSIHSSHPSLATYKGYWQDPELGPFFKRKNEQFLARGDDRKVLRVFVCDSVAESVAESWFVETVTRQVRAGAHVKVVQIDPEKVSGYEDFGLYEHDAAARQAGTYLLLAPRNGNAQQRGLATSVTADVPTIAGYARKFETLWAQSTQPLEFVRSPVLDEAARQPLDSHGHGKITDLFGGRIILRKMERLDTRERLLGPTTGFVRKYQVAYAKALSSHLKLRFPDIDHLLYVGDTHKNDGTAIRNLQALGWDVSGFICEPKLGIGQLWFSDVLYTNRWTDLVGFADRVRDKCGPSTLAIFDIDQTLWAPKGVHEGPLTSSRTRAMSRLIDEYVDKTDSDVARRAKARLALLYQEISEVKYLPLTLDNEDFKAAICVFLSLNLMFDQHRLESGGREEGAAFFEEVARLEPPYYLELVRNKYLPTFVKTGRGGEAGITHFIMETLSVAQTYQFSLYGETNGILVAKVVEHLREIFREMVGVAPIQYRTFRSKELEEALTLVRGTDDFQEQLVLSKPAWDFATWLKQRGVGLIALSDRPDESTVSPTGDSLLTVPMTIYGKDITSHLPA